MKWEYKVCEADEQLCKLGMDGWELVSVLQNNNQKKFYLKRPIRNFKEKITEEQRLSAFKQNGWVIDS